MKSERDISTKGVCHNMEKQGMPPEYPKRKEEYGSVDFRKSLGRGEKRDEDFCKFLDKLTLERRFMDGINPYEKEPLKPLTDKVDDFLLRHASMNYAEFVKQVNPYEFEENDYAVAPKKALKRRLFDHRARLYIAALHDCEQEGIDLQGLLSKIKDQTIPFLKKERNEPTFDALLKVLGKKD